MIEHPTGRNWLTATPSRTFHRTRKLFRRGSKALKSISLKDVVEIFKLFSQGALAWVLPERGWWPTSRLLGQLEVAANPARCSRAAEQLGVPQRADTELILPLELSINC